MSAAALIPSLLPLLVAIAIRRAEARIHRQLVEARAMAPETAVPLSPSGSLEKRRLQGLIRGGAVRLTGSGKHYLDVDGWNRHQRSRRQRVLFVVSAIVALAGVAGTVLLLPW